MRGVTLTFELVGKWLLHIASILVVGVLAELHRLSIAPIALLATNFGRDDVLWCVLGLGTCLAPRIEFGVVDILLIAHVIAHHVHVRHPGYHLRVGADLVKRGWVLQ